MAPRTTKNERGETVPVSTQVRHTPLPVAMPIRPVAPVIHAHSTSTHTSSSSDVNSSSTHGENDADADTHANANIETHPSSVHEASSSSSSTSTRIHVVAEPVHMHSSNLSKSKASVSLEAASNCPSSLGSGGGAAHPVFLNVYDLHQVNNYLHVVGLGAYHSAVEIFGYGLYLSLSSTIGL